jgi:hypothetical protein
VRRAVLSTVFVMGCGRAGFDAREDGRPPTSDATTDGSGDASSPPSAGLVAWYRLDETSGTSVADSSVTGANGYTNGCNAMAPSWTTGKFVGALEFVAASGDCVETSDRAALDLAGGWSVSTWVELGSIPTAGGVYALVVKPNAASQHNYALFADNSAAAPSGPGWLLDFHDAGGSAHHAKVATVFTTGTWFHLAGTWDGTTLTLYVDAAVAATTVPGATPSATAYSGGGMTVLGRDQCCGFFLDGRLDDVRIYDHALTAPEIASLQGAP